MLLSLLMLSGCKKNNWLDWKAENDIWLRNTNTYTYVNPDTGEEKVFPMTTTETGLKYCIISDPNPTEARPSISSYVTVEYTGSLINGHVFESGLANRVSMMSFVSGFSEGLKKIHTHGDIVMYIPYTEGYGYEQTGVEGATGYIPPYSVLIFRVHLYAVE